MASDNTALAPISIPVSVITGFLGSGKTTLLSRLLADKRMNNAAVIINEFGEIGLDHQLLTSPREDTILLSSGCLCCSLRGDLVNTLTELWNDRARGQIPAFDRVLVETTGLADPAPVLLTVTADDRLSEVFHVERLITSVDAVHGSSQIDNHPEAVKQACVADVLLLTKTDIAGGADLDSLRTRLRRLNPVAITRDVVHGEIDPDLLFNFAQPGAARSRDFSGLLAQVKNAGHGAHDHNDHHDHASESHGGSHGGISSFATVIDAAVTFHGLQVWMGLLGEMKGPNLLRIKGIVNVAGRPVVIQAVQHMFHPLSELPEWPDQDRRSRVVFITRDIPREEIERTLGVLSLEISAQRQETAIDPNAFRQFVAAASKFR
jgi:G3E family GTPase